MKKHIFFILTIFLITQTISAQTVGELGSPYITTYSAIEYGANNQNWSVVQDNRGIMYFGNTSGILEFDGLTWKIFQTETNSTVRSLGIDDKSNIFFAGNGTFGKLEADSTGNIFCESFISKVQDTNQVVTDFKKLCITTHGVYFFLKDYIYHYKDDSINYIPFTAASMFAFNICDIVFTISSSGGIYAINDGELTFLPGTSSITENSGRILILKYDDENILIVTENNGMTIYNIGNFFNSETQKYDFENLNAEQKHYQFENEIDQYISTNKIYSAINLKNGDFAIGTVYGGLVIINKEGKLQQIVNKNRGLLDESVIDICQDRDNNLWITHLQGISYIHYNNPLTKFQDNEGIEGSVYNIYQYKDVIFAGTSLGLFYLPKHQLSISDDKSAFSFIEGTLDRVWDFLQIEDFLVATASSTLQIIKDTVLVDNFELKENYTIVKPSIFENKIFIGSTVGFSALDYNINNNKLEFSNIFTFEDIKASIREILPFGNSLWLTSSYSGIYQVEFPNKDFNEFNITHFDTLRGLPDMGYNYVLENNNQFFIGTNKGDRQLNNENIFEKSNLFNCPELDSIGITEVHVVDGKTWILSSSSHLGYLEDIDRDGIFSLNRTGLFKIRGYSIYSVFIDDKNVLWLSTNDGVYRYDTKKTPELDKPYKTLLREIKIGKDSVIFNGTFTSDSSKSQFIDYQPKSLIPVFNYETNSISFKFTSTFYEASEINQYSYFLEGFDDEWSNWKELTTKDYTYLREGHYTFHVKSKNIYEKESEITTFSFIVKPPWYRTILAYIVYIILLGTFIFLIVYLNGRRLKALNLRLEKIIDDRTAEIRQKNQRLEQQKEEILAQSEQLEMTNKELEKLSIVASETDNAVLIMDSNGNFEWANEGFTRLYGFTLDEFIDIAGTNLLNASSNKLVKESVEKCITTKKSVIYESQFKTKENQILWLQTTLTPILNKLDEVIKLIAIESDIRKLKEYESEILQKNEEINTQKEELEQKSQLLQEHNENMRASIRYAKTIQNAILPFKENIDKVLETFILYQPKDIVSGDFYWFSHYCKTKTTNAFSFFAVVDCTGHGVPGAFMSMIGSRLLNEIVNERRTFNTANILSSLQTGIQKALKQDQTENHDGMDVCLCKIEELENSKFEISFTGAKRSLFYLKKNEATINELKADRISIGGINYTTKKSFTVQKVTLDKNDIIYLSTDGYGDQNNLERKRIGNKAFTNILSNIYEFDMEQQKKLLEEFLKDWMNTAEQRDDITVVGIKL